MAKTIYNIPSFLPLFDSFPTTTCVSRAEAYLSPRSWAYFEHKGRDASVTQPYLICRVKPEITAGSTSKTKKGPMKWSRSWAPFYSTSKAPWPPPPPRPEEGFTIHRSMLRLKIKHLPRPQKRGPQKKLLPRVTCPPARTFQSAL